MRLSGKVGIVTTAIFINSLLFAGAANAQQQPADQPVVPNSTALQADALYFEAIKARNKGDNKQAESLLQEVLKLNPNGAGAYYDLARLSMPDKPDNATKYIKKAIELEPSNPYYKVQHAEILAFRNNFEEAANVFAKLAQQEKHNEDYLLKAAMLYQRAGKLKESLDIIDKLIAKTGEDDEMLIEKQRLYLKMNNVEGAAGVAKRLIEKNPKEGKYYVLLADIYANNKQEAKAKEVYDQAEKLFADDPAVQLGLSDYYRRNNDSLKSEEFAKMAVSNKALDAETQIALLVTYFQEAGNDSAKRKEGLKLAEDIAQQNPKNAQVQAVYGDILSINGKKDEATKQYKVALDLDQSSYQAWQNLLYGFTERQYADSLIFYSEKALRLFPNQAMLHYLNGVGHLNKKSYTSAIKSVNRAIDMQPEDNSQLMAEMYSTLGDIYNIIKEYKLSDESYDKALKIDGNNATVLNNYAYYLSLRGTKLDEAEKMSKRSLDIRPNEATFLDTYGWVLYKQGKYDKAREYIQKALDANPAADGTLYEHLGDVHYKLNKTDKAVEYWKQAKEKGTDNNDTIDKKIKDRKLYD
ncbi:MAG: tetratricopeptide repeat protein [Sphingobacteriales bacterium]|nr:MAG: tetratricopeptide repeat protein [Sphingobacteriales bacterium]